MPEIELKLAATPADLRLVKRKLLMLSGRERASRTTLTTVYYDTSDRRLKQQGLTLRVRHCNRRFVQTVKAVPATLALPLVRAEWEDAVAGTLPDLGAPNSGRQLPKTLTAAELEPVFSTIVRRAVITLSPDGSTKIEAAVDDGELRTAVGERSEPICEVELEHKEGDQTAIYAVGLELLEIAPLRIEIRSKAERGFALLGADPPGGRAVHAAPIAIKPKATVEAVLRGFGCECLAVVLRNEPCALAGDAEGLHQMRVAIRRLRAVLSALKRMLPAEQYRWVCDELRWLARALGPARNWDVFTSSILAPVGGALLDPNDRDALARASEQQRLRAHREAETAIRSTRYTAAILKLFRWLTAREWRDQPVSEQSALLLAPIGEVAPRLIARRHKRVCKALRDFAALDTEERHQARIAIKKLRYTVDLFESMFARNAVAKFVRLLKPLQDELGHANDVRVAKDLIAELPISDADRAVGVVLGWHDRGLADRERDLIKQVDKVRHARQFW